MLLSQKVFRDKFSSLYTGLEVSQVLAYFDFEKWYLDTLLNFNTQDQVDYFISLNRNDSSYRTKLWKLVEKYKSKLTEENIKNIRVHVRKMMNDLFDEDLNFDYLSEIDTFRRKSLILNLIQNYKKKEISDLISHLGIELDNKYNQMDIMKEEIVKIYQYAWLEV